MLSVKRNYLVFVLVASLVIMNALLVWQNRSLKTSISEANRSIVLKQGSMLPPLSGLDARGGKVDFRYGIDRRKTLLLVFSPSCGYCTENMPNWQAIARNLDADSYRVIAVSTLPQGVEEYVNEYSLGDIPVIADADPKSKVSYEMGITPQTILIDPDGRVEEVWIGLIGDEDKIDIENTLGVKLPATGENTAGSGSSSAPPREEETHL